MTVLKKAPINEVNKLIINGAVASFFSQTLGFDKLDSDVPVYFKGILSQYLDDFKALGFRLVGLWDYDPDAGTFAYNGLTELVNIKLQRYRFILQNFDAEFAKITNTLSKSFSGTNNGTRRSAAETSPITSASITSAPSASTTWNLANPTSKAGSQYDNAHSNTETDTDPSITRMVMEYQINGMNLPEVVRKFAYSLVEEYNTVY